MTAGASQSVVGDKHDLKVTGRTPGPITVDPEEINFLVAIEIRFNTNMWEFAVC